MQTENERAHAAIGARIDQVEKHLSEQIESMAEDVGKIPQIEAEVRHINQRLGNLEGTAVSDHCVAGENR